MSHEPVQNFVEAFTKLVDKASASQGLFGDVAIRLADDAKKLSQMSEIIANGMHELENCTLVLLKTTNESESTTGETTHSLDVIHATSKATVMEAETLKVDSMELGKLGDQLNIMVGNKVKKIDASSDQFSEETEDNIEMF